MKTIGIIAHIDRSLVRETGERIINWSENNGLKCRLCSRLVDLIGRKDIAIAREEDWKSCDAIITLGGDGSMLASARSYGKYGVPIVGINLGKLGFLTEVNQNQIESSLSNLKEDRYKIEERMVLESTVPWSDSPVYTLNDVVVDHGQVIGLAKIDLFSDGEFVCSYDSDGVIVATPTGSTAYTLSVGGPVIHPQMDAIAVSPVSPHTLTLRTIIFPGNTVLKIRSGSTDRRLRVASDGQLIGELESGQEVSIREAGYKLKLIKFESRSFYEVLRTKLHWGARPLFNT